MKPRYEAASAEAYELLRKAHDVEKRLDTLEKAKMCPCGSGKPQASCCPNPNLNSAPDNPLTLKGEHHKAQTFGTTPDDSRFHIETGGQTYNAFYNTNQSLLDSEDVANKGAKSEGVNLDSLPMKNTHDDTVNRLVEG
tara:strand:+ start:5344 stop:5757 length:414 start_codon:yes stop_codon:yes gene_type:complete